MPETGTIAIHLRTIRQLFNSLDPSPFYEKDLDDAAEEHIVGWARELPENSALEIVVHLPSEEARGADAVGLASALSHYFEYRAQQFEREQRELFRIGRRSLAIGITVLVVCLTASQLLARLIPDPTLKWVVEESLIIVGWVANWRPIEIYLYEWWPIRSNVRLYRRIAAAPVTIAVAQS
jgi:hypothetical protein